MYMYLTVKSTIAFALFCYKQFLDYFSALCADWPSSVKSYQVIIFLDQELISYRYSFVVVVGLLRIEGDLFKNGLRLGRLKSDRDEIWQTSLQVNSRQLTESDI